ncbi:hypothetical protein ABC255_17025 [Neobacillus sp. 3P2-tot-E-2]|uniref:hypothetical protein n=1 Tax=Neobacillus sp. 3P2-tot-E-2 TaxID=3132212 RepID=UPI0039A045CD
MPRTNYFEIKKGDLFGTYVISNDIISNESFSDSKTYLSALIDNNWYPFQVLILEGVFFVFVAVLNKG